MVISDLLFEVEVAINDQLTAGYYGDHDDPSRQAIVNTTRTIETMNVIATTIVTTTGAVHAVERRAPGRIAVTNLEDGNDE